MKLFKILLLILLSPIWIPLAVLAYVFVMVVLPMLFQLIVILGAIGALWIVMKGIELFL